MIRGLSKQDFLDGKEKTQSELLWNKIFRKDRDFVLTKVSTDGYQPFLIHRDLKAILLRKGSEPVVQDSTKMRIVVAAGEKENKRFDCDEITDENSEENRSKERNELSQSQTKNENQGTPLDTDINGFVLF